MTDVLVSRSLALSIGHLEPALLCGVAPQSILSAYPATNGGWLTHRTSDRPGFARRTACRSSTMRIPARAMMGGARLSDGERTPDVQCRGVQFRLHRAFRSGRRDYSARRLGEQDRPAVSGRERPDGARRRDGRYRMVNFPSCQHGLVRSEERRVGKECMSQLVDEV